MNRKMDELFRVVAGSYAYGTAVPGKSDVDIRGVFLAPRDVRLSIFETPTQIKGEGDTVHYELREFCKLAAACNPNIVELLFPPQDTLEYLDPRFELLLQNRSLFLSRKVLDTFVGYAKAQIKKAKGVNKHINQPQPQNPPEIRQFIKVIPLSVAQGGDEGTWWMRPEMKLPPMRPVPYGYFQQWENSLRLAKLEGTENVYRVYYDQDKETGGILKNNALVVSPITKDQEWSFMGLLIYNEFGFNEAKKKHSEYWQWHKTKNQTRYTTEDGKDLDYDAKNMMHCTRLVLSGTHLLQFGEPIVRFHGSDLELLKSIRRGEHTYDEILDYVEAQIKVMDNIVSKSPLPIEPDMDGINWVYQTILERS
jgi:hypothetical protein